ncbi:MAG: hypothetical protein ACI9EF_001709 [Pseudohongiellaceae bacterium]|jgi:hypothetical protein
MHVLVIVAVNLAIDGLGLELLAGALFSLGRSSERTHSRGGSTDWPSC